MVKVFKTVRKFLRHGNAASTIATVSKISTAKLETRHDHVTHSMLTGDLNELKTTNEKLNRHVILAPEIHN